jgi:hypothetical protein
LHVRGNHGTNEQVVVPSVLKILQLFTLSTSAKSSSGWTAQQFTTGYRTGRTAVSRP